MNQLINQSDFTSEGNWGKNVIARNGVKEAIFIRES